MNMFNAKIAKERPRADTYSLCSHCAHPYPVCRAGHRRGDSLCHQGQTIDGRGWRNSHRHEDLDPGTDDCRALATDVFNANYGANPPTPTVTFPTDSYGDQQVKVTATANVQHPFHAVPAAMGGCTGERHGCGDAWQTDYVHRVRPLRLNDLGWRPIGTGICRSDLRQHVR